MDTKLESLSNGVLLASMAVFEPTNLQRIKDNRKDDPELVRIIE